MECSQLHWLQTIEAVRKSRVLRILVEVALEQQELPASVSVD